MSVAGRMKVTTTAVSLAQGRMLSLAADLVRARRGLNLTGVREERWSSTSKLLSAPTDEQGYIKTTSIKQVALIAEQIIEPEPDITPINMLSKLPADDAIFYSNESNVISNYGKCTAMAR